ncbi:MAG: PBP1A family penicillin-binding protein [Candidatus Paceibacterota bacterium]
MKKKHQRYVAKHIGIKLFLLSLIGGFVVLGGGLLWVATLQIPSLTTFDDRLITESTKIYDRTGEHLLYDVHENIRRTVVPFEDISRNIKNASVAIEDEEFYSHKGIKPKAILRAVWSNFLTVLGSDRYTQGGSTITQQVIKNSVLTSEKKIARKVKEWVLALKLEQVMSKDQILNIYLNEIPYGGNMYGAEEASLAFFGKRAREVTLAEAAYLAAIPQAPTFFSPYGNNTDRLEVRKNLVLERMLNNNFITQEEYDGALAEEVTFRPRSEIGIQAPHFVFYIIEQLEEQYGQKAIQEEGLKVITTLDYDLQLKAEEIVKRFALSNAERFDAENAALVSLNAKTGDILTMVGSRDYFDEEIDGNFNITLAERQPGSTFKPFVYAAAFKKGYLPDTVVFDLETEFSTQCYPDGKPRYSNSNCYMPENYDGKFRGPMTLREALAQSINIPAIKALYLAGLDESLRVAKDMGLSTLGTVSDYGLTLVLGGGEVTPLEMTSAYGVFANEGMRVPYRSILRIENKNGVVFESPGSRPYRVLTEDVALTVTDILSDNVARAPSYGSNSPLHFSGYDVAAKTGTTNDYKDAWVIGYTPEIVVGAWAGNNDNRPMNKQVAGLIIAPLWNAFMIELLQNTPKQEFRSPRPIVNKNELKPVIRGEWKGSITYTIDTISQKLATEYTPNETKEVRVINDVHSILHWVDRSDPLGPPPSNPAEASSQYIHWEYPVRRWVERNNINETSTSTIPTEFDTVHTPETVPKLTVSGIDSNISYAENNPITLMVNNENIYPLTRLDIFINNEFIDSIQRPPFNYTFIPGNIPSIRQSNSIRIVGYDSVYNRAEITLPLTTSPAG